MNSAMKRKRPQIGILVTQETKKLIKRMAQESGRSMGQTVELLIEEALHTRRILNALGHYYAFRRLSRANSSRSNSISSAASKQSI